MRTSTVLVVDSYQPFRRAVRLVLQQRKDLQIIGEATDGLEAVQKAKELRPDLVLLDVALPKLNGIQAARRLRALDRRAKILFLSIESCSDIVNEALNVGASGYVHKLHTTSDLLPAIESILHGTQFVSNSLQPFTVGSARDDHYHRPNVPLSSSAKFTHEVAFYEDDAAFADGFARFIETNLNGGNVAIMAVTESHSKSILQNLQSYGLNIEAFIQQGSYVPLDANEILSEVIVNDWPDPARLEKLLVKLVERAANKPGKPFRVAVCGELAPTLWAEGKTRAAIQLERFWGKITRSLGIDTLCGYLSSIFPDNTEAFESICAEHTAGSSH